MGVDLQQLGSGMRKATEAWLTSYKQSQLGWNSLNNSQWVRDSSPMSEDFKFSFSASQHFSWNHEHYSFIRKIACSAWHEHGTIGFEIMTYEIPIQCSDYRAMERQRDRETELQFEPWVMYVYSAHHNGIQTTCTLYQLMECKFCSWYSPVQC